MAFGLGQSGGLQDPPLVVGVGAFDWASMTSMSPSHPLVGGNAPGSRGYGASHGIRAVALAAPDPTAGVASGAPSASHWSQVFNLRGNPIGWVLILAVFYLGVSSIHLRASASGRVGK